jgi:acetyl esterase/lipase
MIRALTLGLLGYLLAASAPAPAQPAAPATSTQLHPIQVKKGIVYGTADGQKLLLDMARPKEGGPYPLVVLMHGGAWRYGSRADLSRNGRDVNGKSLPSIIDTVAAHGYVAVSVGYRLAPKYKFPAQLEDVRTALDFLRDHAKEYDIDPDRIAVGGFSAGAHLALLEGLEDPRVKGDNGDTPPRIKAIISFFGPTDLSLYKASPGLEDAYFVPVFGKNGKIAPVVYKEASPITYVSRDDPSVLLVHGTFDFIVPIIHSEHLYKKLKDAGVDVEMITVPGAGHGWGGATATKTTLDAIKFLDEHLKGKK